MYRVPSQSQAHSQEGILFHITLKPSTKECSRQRLSLYRRVHDEQRSLSTHLVRIKRREKSCDISSHVYGAIQVMTTFQFQVSEELSFLFEFISQLRLTKNKVSHSVLRLQLIWITNALLMVNST